MTLTTILRSSAAAALAATALFAAAPPVHACGAWQETEEKILAFDTEGRHALVLATTRRFGYSGTSERHQLFIVDLEQTRPDDSPLAMEGAAIEVRLGARERVMPVEALAARLARRNAARFPHRA
jgi:hypothetical protein